MEIRAHMVSAGKAEGKALVYKGPFSFMGDLDPNTGKIPVPRHPLEGEEIANRVFVFTTGKGSSGGDCIAWTAKENRNAPSAIICLESEPVLSGAVIITGIPAVDRPEGDIFEMIHTGDNVRVDATAGVIQILGR